MLFYKTAYVLAVFLAGMGSVVASLFYPGDELVMISLGNVAHAVLTFPLGIIAAVTGSVGIYTGFATPAEVLFAMTPVHAVLGYLQWWRLFPWLYRNRL
ncbi:hypothetical protein [Rhizobium sp. LjRoot254]|uniref:hypothetical protein n=1 Tax=Rhizobium sp. LjRoot254 TaxID=3342297 RepID=UPI003ED0B5AA